MMIRPKKSYREQFLSRQSQTKMEQSLSASGSSSTKKTGPVSILKRSNIPLRKKSNESPRQVRSAQGDEFDKYSNDEEEHNSTYANPQLEEGNNKQNMIVKRRRDIGAAFNIPPEVLLDLKGDICSSSQQEFHRMMSEYANVFDLQGCERQYLGLENTPVNESPSQTKATSNSSDHNQPSAWTSILKQLPLENWFGNAFSSNTNTDSKNQNNNNNTAFHNSDSDYSDNARETEQELQVYESEEDHLAQFPLCVLNLINRGCEHSHTNINIDNCFKCQFMESFKFFTLEYLSQMESVWGNQHFSLREKEDQLNEIFQMWIFHLSEQNLSLAETYNESIGASYKVKKSLVESKNALRMLQKEHEKCKACNDALYYELSLRDSSIKKLKSDKEVMMEKMRQMEEISHDAEADKNSLTELLNRLRDKGVWDISGLPLTNETYKKIFTGNYYLHGAKVVDQKEFSSKKREWKDEVDRLKVEMETLQFIVAAKEKEILRLKNPKRITSC